MGSVEEGLVANHQPTLDISRESFLPSRAPRTVRGWDRVRVPAHAPRLHGRKVWKKNGAPSTKAAEEDDAPLQELLSEGSGARKKMRVTGAPQNISNATWKESGLYAGQENAKPPPSKSPRKKAPAVSLKQGSMPELHFVPRKRTNNNQIITPKKVLRQTTIDRAAQPLNERVNGVSPSKSPAQSPTKSPAKSPSRRSGSKRPRKSLRKSLLIDLTHKQAAVLQLGVRDRSSSVFEPSIDIAEPAQQNDPPVQSPVTSPRKRRHSRRSASLITLVAQNEDVVPVHGVESSIGSLHGCDERATPSSCEVERALSLEHAQDVESGATDESASQEHVTREGSAEGDTDEEITPQLENLLVSDPAKDFSVTPVATSAAASQEPESSTEGGEIGAETVLVSTACGNDLSTSCAAKDTVASSEELDVDEPRNDSNAEEEDNHTEAEPLPTGETAVVATLESVPETLTEETRLAEPEQPADSSIVDEAPSFAAAQEPAEQAISSSPDATHDGASEPTGNSVEAATVSNDGSASVTSSYDHDDADMLRNFLTKVKANKAAKKSPRRKKSLPHSPLRLPLGALDSNLSPSPPGNEADPEPAEPSSPTRSKKVGSSTPIISAADSKSIRRSARTRLPVKEPPAGPSFIPVRRLGQDLAPADTTITLKRNEEKELAALTRVNTRKNKGTALSARELLAKQADQKDDPILRQKSLKEAFEEKKAKGSGGKSVSEKTGREKKVVMWAEELVHFQIVDGKKGVLGAEQDLKESVAVEETKAITAPAVKVGVRSRGVAAAAASAGARGGTAAPKRRLRGVGFATS